MSSREISRRGFIKKSAKMLAYAYASVVLAAYSSKAFAFSLNIADEVIKYVSQYFGLKWITDMQENFNKVTNMIKDMYGVVGGTAGEDDSNVKEIVGVSRSNDSANTINETIFNIEVATETQPAAIDACLTSGNKKNLHSIQSSIEAEAGLSTVRGQAYSPKPLDVVHKVANNGGQASKSLNRMNAEPKMLDGQVSRGELGQIDTPGPAWLNVSSFLTDAGYHIEGESKDNWTNNAAEFLRYLLSDSGLVPDADILLNAYNETSDIRLGALVQDVAHIVNARAMVEVALQRMQQVRVRREDIFNYYSNGEKEYVENIAKNHSVRYGNSYLMSVIDSFNSDVERFSQSKNFIQDVIKSEGLNDEQKKQAEENKRIVEELAVGHTPLLITASSMISAQQKWTLDIYEQNETIMKMQSVIGLLDQLISNEESSSGAQYVFHVEDPIFNFYGNDAKMEFLV